LLDQFQHRLGPTGYREVDCNRALSAVEQVICPRHQLHAPATGPIDTHHIGAQIGEQHSTEGPRSDPGYFENLHTGQRPSSHVRLHSTMQY
jgi:hypothetical protein